MTEDFDNRIKYLEKRIKLLEYTIIFIIIVITFLTIAIIGEYAGIWGGAYPGLGLHLTRILLDQKSLS